MYPFKKLQVWRAATSISANIAEGSGAPSHAVFARHLGSALGSAHELENHLLIASDAALMSATLMAERIEELIQVRRMLWTLRERVRKDPRGKPRRA
jgi:four helix bundle protein